MPAQPCVEPDLCRRCVVRALGSLGFSTLAGCACPLPSWRLGEIPAGLGAGVLRAPKPADGAITFPVAFDTHSHIFNAQDVPGAAFLRGPVAHLMTSEIARDLVRALAGAVALFADMLAPSARTEIEILRGLYETHARVVDDRWSLPAGVMKDERDRRGRVFAQIVRESPAFAGFRGLYRKQWREFDADRSRYLNETEKKELVPLEESAGTLSEEMIFAIVTGRTRRDHDLLYRHRAIRAGRRPRLDPRDLVKFGFALLSPRFVNLWVLRDDYRGDPKGPTIDAFMPSMLDFDRWLGCPSAATVQDDQIRLMEQLAVMSGGAILPLVGYNPLTDVLQSGASLARVRKAVATQGFVGVKIYPPMGFSPAGNRVAAGSLCSVAPDATEIAAALHRLYAWCIDNDVPIMAHTSHSMGSSDENEENAGPAGWDAALAKCPGLRVQAGHFGGDSDTSLYEQWANGFVDLMRKPHGEHVYADLSNLVALLVPGSRVERCISALIGTALPSGETVTDRLLYGSDFYMLELEGAGSGYAGDIARYLASRDGSANPISRTGAKVFGANAVRFYGLANHLRIPEEKTNRGRLDAFYGRHGVPEPVWASKVDALAKAGGL